MASNSYNGLEKLQLGFTPATAQTNISMSQTYNREIVKPFYFAAKVTCTSANAVYDIGNPVATVGGSGLVDGTNLLAITEMSIELNDFTQPAGSTAATVVSLFRTNSNDGTASSACDDPTIVAAEAMIAQSVVYLPYVNLWSVKKFKVASSSAGAVLNITLKGVYYTPSQ